MFPTPTHDIEVPSRKMTFDPLNVEFMVDEQLQTYREVFDWMQTIRNWNGKDIHSCTADIHVDLMLNSMNKFATIVFEDAYPSVLTEIQYSTQEEPNVMVSSVVFKYTQFRFV